MLESPRFEEIWQLYASEERVLDAAHSIAGLLQDWNWFEKAEEMYSRALDGYETALRRDYTSTLSTINNLGTLYRDQGNLAEAEKMLKPAVDGFQKLLGSEHPSTLRAMNKLKQLDLGNGMSTPESATRIE